MAIHRLQSLQFALFAPSRFSFSLLATARRSSNRGNMATLSTFKVPKVENEQLVLYSPWVSKWKC